MKSHRSVTTNDCVLLASQSARRRELKRGRILASTIFFVTLLGFWILFLCGEVIGADWASMIGVSAVLTFVFLAGELLADRLVPMSAILVSPDGILIQTGIRTVIIRVEQGSQLIVRLDARAKKWYVTPRHKPSRQWTVDADTFPSLSEFLDQHFEVLGPE